MKRRGPRIRNIFQWAVILMYGSLVLENGFSDAPVDSMIMIAIAVIAIVLLELLEWAERR